MDTLTVNPLFTSSCFIKPPRYSFFKFYKTSRIYSQITPSPCPQNPKKSKQNQYTNWVVPVLQRVKLLASSQKRKWVSLLQAYSDESEKSMNECCGGNEYLQNGVFKHNIPCQEEMGFEDTVCLWRNPVFTLSVMHCFDYFGGALSWMADPLFPVCLGFSLIVMYDAIGVRRHAGMQAEVLNMIVADLFQAHPVSQRKLKKAHPAH